jgi:ubiquinone/menaquinone biosynthesis C-methylase UbiE
MQQVEMITERDHKQAIKDYFSGSVNYWKNVYKDKPENRTTSLDREMKARKEYVLSFVDLYAKGSSIKVLDIGCGSGGILEDLFKQNYIAYGLDISWKMILEAVQMSKKYVPKRTTNLNGDAEKLPFKENSFDAVLGIGVLQYLEGDNVFIRESCRVVKHGGIIILTTPNILRINNIFDPYYYACRVLPYFRHRLFGNKKSSDRDVGKNKNFSSRRYFMWQLNKEIKSQSLIKVGIYAVGFGPMTIWRKEFIPVQYSIKISDFCERAANDRCLSLLKIFANRWVYCFQKK